MTANQLKILEVKLWQAADKLRVDSSLKASEYATPILGLIFLRFASIRYKKVKPEIDAELKAPKNKLLQRNEHEIAIEKCGFYLPPEAEYEYLLALPEQKDIAKAIKQAMEKIELYKPELKGNLPKDEYFKLVSQHDKSLPKSLLKIFADIPEDATGDVFGKVYEYFLAEFALSEGQGGGEFFTPTSVVKLMVEIIEPYKGTIFDPACGSGGMFVQSNQFIDRRREELHETDAKDLMVYGCERTPETVKLARMNLAVNGLRGEIVAANSYYDDCFNSYQKFDYIMANPPFNVDDVNLDRVKGQQRFSEYGIPQNKSKGAGKKSEAVTIVPNANYLWINLFATSLKPKGRAALVMANSASDAKNSEAEIRQKIIQSGVIDCMLTLPKNMFYTVTLPATLWFFDKGKSDARPTILFIDARNIFRQVTRALREFTDEHIQNIATIVRLYRGETTRLTELIAKYKQQAAEFEKRAAIQYEVVKKVKAQKPENEKEIKRWEKGVQEEEKNYETLQARHMYFEGHIAWLNERFPNGVYEDVTGLCKATTLQEIEEQDWSLNPGRYVGVVMEEDGITEDEFLEEMQKRHHALQALNKKAVDLENQIAVNFKSICS
ncbi:SAM-dependent DNA methyltransferase [Niastella caeni]|uniref:site-specific DNA-methyltransferase (adenine-specific) n=2 Tax=Niastella caeni TaxID=2569763 RepID=A0A4S8HQ05_9BACT|nr:SAM-dependent DNA methyltransferase [Niastella caeni]